MSADELRQAAETLRARATAVDDREDGLALADWLEEVAAWREEGLGLLPMGNLADAWLCVEDRAALALARLINGGAA